MEDDITKKVQNRFAELPPDVQQAVEAADLSTRVQTIGAKHRLHLDQMGVLEDETLLVMLGFTETGQFVDSVVSHLGIPREQAGAIATDINNQIFGPIRESLKKFSERRPAAEAPATPAPPAAPSPSPSLTPTPPKPTAPAPAAPPPATPAGQSPLGGAKPQVPLAPHPHDLMLTEKTITTPPNPQKSPAPATPPAKPQNYKADPYREPPGP